MLFFLFPISHNRWIKKKNILDYFILHTLIANFHYICRVCVLVSFGFKTTISYTLVLHWLAIACCYFISPQFNLNSQRIFLQKSMMKNWNWQLAWVFSWINAFFVYDFLQKNGRVYKIGKRFIEIHRDVLNDLLQWNAFPQRNDPTLDHPFGLSLLLSLISTEKIEAGEIDPNAVSFVLGKII